jgi:hypothetical protein
MRAEWIVASMVALVAGWIAISWFSRHGRRQEAHTVAALMVLFGFVVVFLLSMESDWLLYPSVNIAGATKKLLLGISGGLLSGAMLALNRVANGRAAQGRVSRVFLRGVVAAGCGLVGAGLASLASPSLASLSDQAAAMAGVAGGGAGVSVLDVARRWLTKSIGVE